MWALLIGGIWQIGASRLELNVSATHSIIGAIVGFAMAYKARARAQAASLPLLLPLRCSSWRRPASRSRGAAALPLCELDQNSGTPRLPSPVPLSSTLQGRGAVIWAQEQVVCTGPLVHLNPCSGAACTGAPAPPPGREPALRSPSSNELAAIESDETISPLPLLRQPTSSG